MVLPVCLTSVCDAISCFGMVLHVVGDITSWNRPLYHEKRPAVLTFSRGGRYRIAAAPFPRPLSQSKLLRERPLHRTFARSTRYTVLSHSSAPCKNHPWWDGLYMVDDITSWNRPLYHEKRPAVLTFSRGGRYRIRTYHLHNVNVAL